MIFTTKSIFFELFRKLPLFFPQIKMDAKVFSSCPILLDFLILFQCPCPWHSVKCVRIRSFSGAYFPAFVLNTERYGVSLYILYECGKVRTRKTSKTDTFLTVRLKVMKSKSDANRSLYVAINLIKDLLSPSG